MKIAIHDRENSFSKGWIKYCEEKKISFKFVNCYANDIFEQLEDCYALMWHWSHIDRAAELFARQLIFSIESIGKKVFPDLNTCRFFDDKIGQTYLFKAMNVPHIQTYVFYDKQKALEWIETTVFPKVFKLSKGAGSSNVRLIKSKNEAVKLINISFGKGFKPVASYFSDVSRKVKKEKTIANIFHALLRSSKTIKNINKLNSQMNFEKGYVYFQDFIPGNKYDIRIVIIGNKAFSILRKCRKNDFRASGSGIKDYNPHEIDKKCVEIASNISKKMKFQSMAYDFIFDELKNPLLVEMSYCFQTTEYPGYYNNIDLEWKYENTFICDEILKFMVKK